MGAGATDRVKYGIHVNDTYTTKGPQSAIQPKSNHPGLQFGFEPEKGSPTQCIISDHPRVGSDHLPLQQGVIGSQHAGQPSKTAFQAVANPAPESG
jgi:hypothetical protein